MKRYLYMLIFCLMSGRMFLKGIVKYLIIIIMFYNLSLCGVILGCMKYVLNMFWWPVKIMFLSRLIESGCIVVASCSLLIFIANINVLAWLDIIRFVSAFASQPKCNRSKSKQHHRSLNQTADSWMQEDPFTSELSLIFNVIVLQKISFAFWFHGDMIALQYQYQWWLTM